MLGIALAPLTGRLVAQLTNAQETSVDLQPFRSDRFRDAFDNAVAESFFAMLETELLDRSSFRSRDRARLALFHRIEGFYNSRHRHSTLGQRSPANYERIMLEQELTTAAVVQH